MPNCLPKVWYRVIFSQQSNSIWSRPLSLCVVSNQGAIGQRCSADAFFMVSLQDMVPIIVDYCLLLQRKWVYIACQVQLFWVQVASCLYYSNNLLLWILWIWLNRFFKKMNLQKFDSLRIFSPNKINLSNIDVSSVYLCGRIVEVKNIAKEQYLIT